MNDAQKRGSLAEERAVVYLAEMGYEIVERNWKCKVGEIDVIARDDAVLVFVEVRFRSGSRWGSAIESVGSPKIRRIIAAARWYLKHIDERGDVRFDVIAVSYDDQITHIADAFMADVS